MTARPAGRRPLLEVGPRLAICALLQGAQWVEFGVVRDTVGVADPAVSKHARTLEEAGVVEVRKGAAGRRPRTWFRLTEHGRRALEDHLAWLTGLHRAQVGSPGDATP